MTEEEFKDLMTIRIESCLDIIKSKSVEYATQDRLWNFKRAAAIMGQPVPMAVVGMLNKHLVSMLDMAAGVREFTPETLNEKFSDLHNYLFLLEAALKDHREQIQARQMVNLAIDKLKAKADKAMNKVNKSECSEGARGCGPEMDANQNARRGSSLS